MILYNSKYDNSYYLDEQITACGEPYFNLKSNGTIEISKVTCPKCLVCCDKLLTQGLVEAKVLNGRKIMKMIGVHTPNSINDIISKNLESIK